MCPSFLELFGQRLVEGVLGLGLGVSRIELRGLIKEEVSLRWSPCRRERRGQMVQVEVQENAGDDGRIREKGEDPNRCKKVRAPRRASLGASGLAWHSMVRMARTKIRSTAPAISGLWCRKGLRRLGTDNTH